MSTKSPKTAFELAVIAAVRDKRLEKGLSQEDLALILDTDRSFIGQVESHSNPAKYNLNHLNKIALEWGCSPREFLPFEPMK